MSAAEQASQGAARWPTGGSPGGGSPSGGGPPGGGLPGGSPADAGWRRRQGRPEAADGSEPEARRAGGGGAGPVAAVAAECRRRRCSRGRRRDRGADADGGACRPGAAATGGPPPAAAVGMGGMAPMHGAGRRQWREEAQPATLAGRRALHRGAAVDRGGHRQPGPAQRRAGRGRSRK